MSELSEPSLKEIDGEKKEEWKKDVIADQIDVPEVKNVRQSITSLSSLPLHPSDETILKGSENSLVHIGNDGYQSMIIQKALQNVCLVLLFMCVFVSAHVCRVFIYCVLLFYSVSVHLSSVL